MVGEGETRLVGEPELAALRRLAQLDLEPAAVLLCRLERLGVEREAVASAGLGGVEGEIGGAQQAVGVLAVLGEQRRTHADGDRQARLAEIECRPAGLHQPLGEHERLLAVAEIRGHQRELVAAEPRRRVRGTDHAPHALRQIAQQPIAGRVAIAVVDVLEAIDVEDHQRGPRAEPPRAGQGLDQPVEQQEPVGQARQRVVGEQMADTLLGAPPLGDLPRERLVGVPQLDGAVGHRGLQALTGLVEPAHQGRVLEMQLGRAAQGPVHLPADDREPDRVQQREQGHGARDRIGGRGDGQGVRQQRQPDEQEERRGMARAAP